MPLSSLWQLLDLMPVDVMGDSTSFLSLVPNHIRRSSRPLELVLPADLFTLISSTDIINASTVGPACSQASSNRLTPLSCVES